MRRIALKAEDQDRVDALCDEREALNELMEHNPSERTYGNFNRRDAIIAALDRLAPQRFASATKTWPAHDLQDYVQHVKLYGSECVLESAAEDLYRRELGSLKAFIESMEKTHVFKDAHWVPRRTTVRVCEECGRDLPPGARTRTRFHPACQRRAAKRRQRARRA